MNYIESKLNSGEQVIMQTELHQIIFSLPFIVIAVGFIALLPLKQFGHVENYGYIFVGLLSLLFFTSEAIRYATSIYGITSQRVIARTGVLRIKTIEILLNQVETVEVDQTFIGRILGFGTVIITGTGGTNEYLRDLKAPGQFRDAVMGQTTKK